MVWGKGVFCLHGVAERSRHGTGNGPEDVVQLHFVNSFTVFKIVFKNADG
jgi:hypothetical protein